MTLAQEVAALNAAMQQIPNEFEQALLAKAQEVEAADDTKALGESTQAQVKTDMDDALVRHLADRTAHSLSPGQLNTLSGVDVTALFANRPQQGQLPVSRYGTLNYLPAGATGSFEGASTQLGVKDTALLLENDGTLTYLRNGQNGSKLGVYYAFVKDALGPVLNQPTKTNRRYQPAYFPLNTTAAFIHSCSETIVFGRLQDASGAQGDYFISITNGTLDDTNHQGGFITAAQYASLGMHRGEVFVQGNTIYFLVCDYTGAGSFDITIYTVPLQSVRDGGTVVPTRMTGIATTGFNNIQYSATPIRLAQKCVSDSVSDNPILLISGVSGVNLFHFELPSIRTAFAEDGTWRIKFSGMTWGNTAFSSGAEYVSFTVTFNVYAKAAVLDAPFRAAQSKFTFPSPQSVGELTGPIYNWDPAVEANRNAGNSFPVYCYASNHLFVFRVRQTSDVLDLTRTKFNESLTAFAGMLQGATTAQTSDTTTIIPGYGSPIGGSISGPFPISDTRAIVYCYGLNQAGNYFNDLVYTDLEGSPTYPYRSITNGALTGYRPSANRKSLRDAGVAADAIRDFYAPLVEAGTQSMSTGGARFFESRLEGPKLINPDLTTTGRVSVTAAAMASAKQAVIAMVGLVGVTQSFVELTVPRTLVGKIPPLLVVSYTIGATGEAGFIVAFCTVVGGDAITDITVTSAQPKFVLTAGQCLGISNSEGIALQAGAVCMYETTTSILVGYTLGTSFSVVGSSPSLSFRFRVDKSTKVITRPASWGYRTYHASVNGRGYWATPTLGFGMTFINDTLTDDGTKSVFVPIAKDSDSAFDNWGTPATTAWSVITSQDVAAIWQLYFTEPTPLMMNGKVYQLPMQQIDLTLIKANPASTKFYTYVQIVAGVASYLVTLAPQTETAARMYIGYITTGTSAIETIAIEKVTQVGGYRVSPVARGGAIAATIGTPAVPATLQWS